MKEIDWSKAPGDAIGAFSQGESQTFFVKTKEPSDYMNGPGYKGLQCDGNVYHVFTEFWAWSERPWAGEGLPPVGTRCEYFDGGEWMSCEVVAHRNNAAVVLSDCYEADFVPRRELRPIRTPEQIAAEERYAEIQRICTDGESNGIPYFKALDDAGYRKVTP